MQSLNRRIALAISAVALAGSMPAGAAVVVYSGLDIMSSTSDPHPNADAAASSFDAAVSSAGLITFENAPVGSYSSLVVAPGVTLIGNYFGGNQSIYGSDAYPTAPSLDGYNTTAGGSKFAENIGGSLTFTFATPIIAFGAYFTGLQSNFYQDTVSFSDGTSQVLDIPMTGTGPGTGGLAFLGFTDVGKSITSVTVTAGINGGDFIGVDDVRFASDVSSTVPEPAEWAMLVCGFGVIGGAMRRKRALAARA